MAFEAADRPCRDHFEVEDVCRFRRIKKLDFHTSREIPSRRQERVERAHHFAGIALDAGEWLREKTAIDRPATYHRHPRGASRSSREDRPGIPRSHQAVKGSRGRPFET